MPVRHRLHGITFEWDSRKAAANRLKHGVDYEVACEAFVDPFLVVVEAGDERGEARQAVVGMTVAWRFLTVVFVERDDALRIVSARRATAAERRVYEDQ